MAIISFLLIGVTYFLCDSLRRQVRDRLSEGTAKNLILDTLVSAELCFGAFELGVIFEHYGFYAWSVGLFFNCLYQCQRWSGFSAPSPFQHLQPYFAGTRSLPAALLRVATLVSAGLATYCLVHKIWTLEMSVLHAGRAKAVAENCEVPWGVVPTHISFMAEAAGTLFLGVIIPLVAEHPSLANNDPIYTSIVIASIVVATVVAAIDVSGGMFNPMLATTLLVNCKGHAHWQHVLVYWVGGAAGELATAKVYPKVRSLIYGAPDMHKKQI